MQCPDKIAEVLCQILRTGLLRIRTLNDVERCTVEADHLHNLPGLLIDFQAELLDYYWNVERTCYMERSDPEDVAAFQPLWQTLGQHVTPTKGKVIAG